MDSTQALKITILWQQTNDLLSQMQETVTGDGEYNELIQDIETVREKLTQAINRAVNGNGWQYIPIDAEVVPDPVLNLEAWL